MVTVGSILGGRGMWIWYLFLSTPTLIPETCHNSKNVSPDSEELNYCPDFEKQRIDFYPSLTLFNVSGSYSVS